MEEPGSRKVQDLRKADLGVALDDLEECVKRAAENFPAQVIHAGAHATGFDPV